MFVLPSTQEFNFSEFGLLATGLNKTDTQTLYLYTGGQQRVLIDIDGNVGIGITGRTDTTPLSYKLDIDNGDVHINDNLIVDGTLTIPSITIGDDLTVNDALTVIGKTLITSGELCLWNADERIASDGTHMTFDVGGTERMILNNSGSLGIGTNNPITRLHVSGTIRGENFGSGDQELQLQSGRGDRWDIIAGSASDGGSNPLRIGNNGTDYILN